MSRLVPYPLIVLACAAVAQESHYELVRHGKEVYLDGAPPAGLPAVAVHELQAPGSGVILHLEFRFGLYAIGPAGRLEQAVGGLRLEYRRLDGEGHERQPAAFQAEQNPDWTDRPEGDAAEPMQEQGYWFTRAASVHPLERRLVLLFPEPGRYRVLVGGLFGHSARDRRVPTLLAVEEIRVVPPPSHEEPAAEEIVGEEPAACPFCEGRVVPVIWSGGQPVYFDCRCCSGQIHRRKAGKPRCSVRQGGRRQEYDLVDGRPVRRIRGLVPPPGIVRPGLRAPAAPRRSGPAAGHRAQ